MSEPDGRGLRHVPARDIPIPVSVSPEAQAQMAMPTPPAKPFPAPDDLEAWRTRIAAGNAQILAHAVARISAVPVAVETLDVRGAPVYAVTPSADLRSKEGVYLDIHGGALIFGAGECCRAWAVSTAQRIGARVWSVDYRMPPDHPYPAGLDDCVNAYRELLTHKEPHQIVVGGNSAGGNLAAAMLLRARDEGLPLPAAAILGTPQADLTESGDSFQTNLGLDALLGSTMPANLLYAGGQALDHPYLSPLFGDFTKGFPPTLLITGTRDLFLSNTVRMHRALRAADVPADLHVFEAASHGQFPDSPEERALNREIHQFLDLHWR